MSSILDKLPKVLINEVVQYIGRKVKIPLVIEVHFTCYYIFKDSDMYKLVQRYPVWEEGEFKGFEDHPNKTCDEDYYFFKSNEIINFIIDQLDLKWDHDKQRFMSDPNWDILINFSNGYFHNHFDVGGDTKAKVLRKIKKLLTMHIKHLGLIYQRIP